VLELALERLPEPLHEDEVAEVMVAPTTPTVATETAVVGDRLKH
jgi:hypothetical protein